MSITIGNRDRRLGLQSLSEADRVGKTDAEILHALVVRAETMSRSGQQLRFRFADETFSVRQLRMALETGDGSRAADLLRQKGIALPEMIELLDDVVANPRRMSGETIDCRPGTTTARIYGISRAGDDTVNLDRDPARLRPAAEAAPPMTRAFDMRSQRVSGPSFFTVLGEAIVEAIAAVGRLFGASWNPDTRSVNGRVDDAHFQALGRDMARSPHGAVFQLALSSAEGREALRTELMAKKPADANDAQWRRAINDMFAGMRAYFAGEEAAGRLPAGLTDADGRFALTYLRANGYNDRAAADLGLVLAQPPAVRSRLQESLASLPAAERHNLLDLLRPPGNGDEPDAAAFNAYCVRSDFQTARPELRLAMVEVLARNGFRTPIGEPDAAQVTEAVRRAEQLPEAVRARYLALLARLGVSLAHLAADEHGLARRLMDLPVDDQQRLLNDVERNLGSTSTIMRMIAHASLGLRLVRPEAGVIRSEREEAQVLTTVRRRNITLALGELRVSVDGAGGAISLARYFAEPSYRSETLGRLGMTREAFEGFLQNTAESFRVGNDEVRGAAAHGSGEVTQAWSMINDPAATPDLRRSGWADLHRARLQNEIGFGASNVEIDISEGSTADRLFGLRARDRDAPLYGFGAATLSSQALPPFAIVARGRGGAEVRISRQEMAEVLTDPLPAGVSRAQLFRERYPGLDFRDTLAAFAHVTRLAQSTGLRAFRVGDGYAIDLRRRTGDRALDALRARINDGRDGNIARPSFLEAALPLRSTERATPLTFHSNAEIGAVAGNNWFQYGVFNHRQGYFSARAVLAATERAPGLRGFGRALFGLDDESQSRPLARGGSTLETGEATGEVERMFGAGTRPADVRVMTFAGRGSAADERAFRLSSNAIVRAAALGDDGIPAENILRHEGVPTPREMFDEIRVQLLREPRPRTLVVHFAGHTGSHAADVSGFLVRDANGRRAFFGPAELRELNRIAVSEGVNLTWVTDACRGGEYVEQARAETIARLAAAGRLPPSVASLDQLRRGTVDVFRAFEYVSERRQPPAPYPSDRALARLVQRALHDGLDSEAMRELRAQSERLASNEAIPDPDRRLLAMFVASTEDVLTARAALRSEPSLPADMLDHPFLTGDLRWAKGRRFMAYQLGPLYDRMSAALRARMPAMRAARGAV